MDIRWNAGFVRGLAQSVLERAKVIRNSLISAGPVAEPKKIKVKVKKSKTSKTTAARRKPAAGRKSGRNA